MNTKYNELEDRYEVDPQSIVRSELLNVETPNKYVTYAGLERAVKNVLSKAKDYDKGLVGGYNGSFPLTAATKGNIYLLPATKKYYVCITDYSGSQLTAPNANFEELSVYTNRSKLDNLFGVIQFDGGENLGKIIGYKLIQDDFKKLSFIFSYDSSKANQYGEVTINIPNIFSNTNITGSICANDISSFVLDSVLQSEIKVISNTRIKIKITYQTKDGTIVKFTKPCKCLIEILEIKAL